MPRKEKIVLSRRERQIMDVVYRLKKATVQEVLDQLPDPPSYSAVRALMRLLEEKGHLTHVADGNRYVYSPTQPKEKASKTALKHLLDTFFDNSVETAVAALLDVKSKEMSDEEFKRLRKLIDKARKES
ncbi:MAG: BlaI/MecI/CopY family transcriptional regulator [Planctomycetaceae bacterium]|nr:BlaI/MecI/CopY family transcriptional regulator [Planctomycetaceae bacterium]